MTLLKAHMDAVESHLLATSRIPANSGHSLHKGTPREAFIREYLEMHLSADLAIGTGEIIDANSQPGEKRNQIDIVLYRKNYPKLFFGGDINAFLAESVIATIEVKSTLTAEDLRTSIRSARNVKSLTKNGIEAFTAGYTPPSILSYVVAYDGPARMSTVYGWIAPSHDAEGIAVSPLPANTFDRVATASPSIDGIFVLGRGFIQYDNAPRGFLSEARRAEMPGMNWIVADAERGSLLMLFLSLTTAASGMSGHWLNPIPYLGELSLPHGDLGFGP